MPRRRALRIIYPLYEKGLYGPCSCGGSIFYYSDHGVRCDKCKQIYGVWSDRKAATHPNEPTASSLPAKSIPSIQKSR